jgi:2-polyprenyl-3-methyl-5-hydroxy-6-metoxy-1,4-benzoquinol methylase
MEAITNCRLCGAGDLIEFLDLGEQHLSDFRDDQEKTPEYPLVAVLCENCKLVQLKHTTPQSEMYHDRYGFKSGISDSIKKDLDDIVVHAFQYKNNPETWLDIASNDGTLLSFVPEDVFRVGVDPVTFLCEEAAKHADLIVNDYFSRDCMDANGLFDVVTSISCFYDMPDPQQFVSDVKSVMAWNGVWIIQQNYLLTTMELSAVDNFCHEHLEYYTLLSLENLLKEHDLEVNEVHLSMVNGGSIRTVVSRIGTHPVSPSVKKQRIAELKAGIGGIKAYRDFANNVTTELDKLREMVVDLHNQGKSIYILAASTRGATIWQSAGIDEKVIDFAVERNPAKVGKYFTAIGVPIISEEQARELKPDYMIVGPWFFADEIIKREEKYLIGGGKLIVPLPKLEVIGV